MLYGIISKRYGQELNLFAVPNETTMKNTTQHIASWSTAKIHLVRLYQFLTRIDLQIQIRVSYKNT